MPGEPPRLEPSTPDRLLTVREVAVRLGTWETSGERYPRRLIEERRITFVKVGRLVRIPESAVNELITANTVLPLAVHRPSRRSAA
ncbi:excisionase family DNA-binding protein [Kitasatospora sp. NBC_00070]|uniref:excisionase family DNA-binding protein n=1 Tax=Kitasatospora sp. NBC_00070 TaxID=2975962 RepID=UPI00324F4B00